MEQKTKSPTLFDKRKRVAFDKLSELYRRRHKKTPPKYEDQTANGLTRCIVHYLTLKGYQAERINCFGNPIPVGDGTYKMGKTSMHKGTADISAIVDGKAVKIEIKIGADRLSSFQREYKAEVERAGGIYSVVRSFDGFLIWFNGLINKR